MVGALPGCCARATNGQAAEPPIDSHRPMLTGMVPLSARGLPPERNNITPRASGLHVREDEDVGAALQLQWPLRINPSRDLPGSDTIPLHVMRALTPAGRQHLAERCRTCCLRASKNSRPLRCMTFRGSIPHPMQSLCTLRVRRCRRLTQHSLPGGPLRPYLDRTCTG